MWNLEGCAGLVGVMSNIWPRATRYFVEECLKRSCSDLVKESLAASEVANMMNPLAAKMGLFEKGLINCPNTKPPLSIQDFQAIKELQGADQKMSHWEQPAQVT